MIYYALVRPGQGGQLFENGSLERTMDVCVRGPGRNTQKFFSESLILAQNERWQRGLGMQVERDPGDSNISR